MCKTVQKPQNLTKTRGQAIPGSQIYLFCHINPSLLPADAVATCTILLQCVSPRTPVHSHTVPYSSVPLPPNPSPAKTSQNLSKSTFSPRLCRLNTRRNADNARFCSPPVPTRPGRTFPVQGNPSLRYNLFVLYIPIYIYISNRRKRQTATVPFRFSGP